MLCKVTHCAGRVSANTRPHQLRSGGDREMGTAILFTECSQMEGLIQKSVETPRSKARSLYAAVLRAAVCERWLSRVSVRKRVRAHTCAY